jgi:hypothetical protein
VTISKADADKQIRRAQCLLIEAGDALSRLAISLSTGLKTPVKDDVKAAHRREHRRGVVAKIATDSELQAFIAARFDTLTFDQIAKEVAQNFTHERRVSRSSIHRWWLKSQRI